MSAICAPVALPVAARPRLGFAGVGWIGLSRLESIAACGDAEVVCIADPSAQAAEQALRAVLAASTADPGAYPHVRLASAFEELLEEDLDGAVIATPSGQHAWQADAALERGYAVFCQKPLGRTSHEAARTVELARTRDRLLAVDFCYRTVAGVAQLAQLVRTGALGEIYSAELVFHNAYGPDKPWFYDLSLSGGGCVMDLGIHLLDLLLWVLPEARVTDVRSRLRAGGRLLPQPAGELEDHAIAEIQLASGATARLACSWRLPAGREAIIEASFYGTRAAAVLRNVNGSFYDFTVEHCEGTSCRRLAQGPDSWGGRAACAWVRQLAADRRFDASAEQLCRVSSLVDAIYGRG